MKRSLPLLVLALALLWVGTSFKTAPKTGDFDLNALGRLPSLANGRIKPLDSVARNSLLVLQGRQRVKTPDGSTLHPMQWLLDVMLRPEKADTYKVFEITHQEVLDLMQLAASEGDGKKRFSLEQIRPRFEEMTRQARLASQEEGPRRSLFQKEVLKLYSKLDHYQQLRFALQVPDTKDLLADVTAFQSSIPTGVAAVQAKEEGRAFDEKIRSEFLAEISKYDFLAQNAGFRPIPPEEGAEADAWRSFGAGVQSAVQTRTLPAEVLAYAGIANTWTRQNPTQFNEIVRLLTESYLKDYPSLMTKCKEECLFNRVEPFYKASLLYVLAFLAAVSAWLCLPKELARTAFWLTALAFVLSTLGIFARMWLEGRPPVTNLYSSALFVGWAAVLLCLIIEAIYRNALAAMAAGAVGASTLIIAHYLSLGGDTMEMMRAVLDSNFWLATHVVTISIGYSASFLAGFFAIIYVILGALSRAFDKTTAEGLSRIIYGVICFATFFSLIGTLLGGIWADQSWGRFWGWDPKENGALIIVLWNAIFLHVRWGKLAGTKGLLSLAIFGNVVTAWSWFGTNMLGVGLHSYGFNDKGAVALAVFILAMLGLILFNHLMKWRSKGAC